MPRYKRWFNVSQTLNGDPEIWEMTQQFGDRSLRVYLELLSIAEHNEGELPEMSPAFGKVLAKRCAVSGQTVANVWRFAGERLWIAQTSPPRWRNWLKFHPSRETKSANVSGPPSIPSLPSEESDPKKEPAAVDKSPEPDPQKNGLTKEVTEAGTRIYQLDRVKFRRLVVWMQMNKNYPPEILLLAFKKFEPFAEKIDDYWPYLDKCVKKAWAEYQQGGSKREAAGDLEFLKTVVGGIK